MHTSINQRFKEIAEKLSRGNISELSRIIGVAQPALRDIVGKKQTKPRFDILYKIIDNPTLNINAVWLITGEGEMQNQSNDKHETFNDTASRIIPLYDINTATNLQALFEDSCEHKIGEIIIPNTPACDGAIYVRGDGMYPLIKSGDIVSFKKISNIDFFISGELYVVDFVINGDQYLVIKYAKLEEDNTIYRLISHNDHYPDLIIPTSAVRTIAMIKIVIRVNSMV